MKKYKIDIAIGYTNGKSARNIIYTFEKANEDEAIQWAKNQLSLANHMPKIDWFFVYKIVVI